MLGKEQQESSLDWILGALKSESLSLPLEAKTFAADDWAFIL